MDSSNYKSRKYLPIIEHRIVMKSDHNFILFTPDLNRN